MQYWRGCSISDCCSEITTVLLQVKDEEILCKYQHPSLQTGATHGAAKRKHCILDKSEKSLQSSRSPWEIRHRQGSSIKMDGASTKSTAATMVATEPGYLPQDDVRGIQQQNPRTDSRRSQQTTCRQRPIPDA